MTDQIVLLDIECLDPPLDAVRDVIDPDKVRELADSIRSSGLLQPILVRPLNGRYEVVAGHRRFLAHRFLGEVKIKSIIKELKDEEVVLMRAIENDQREDLNPVEKAKTYKRLRDMFGWSTREIGAKMGRHHATILRYLQILETPEEFQRELARGKISIEACLILNEIEDPEFRNYYFRSAIENGVTFEVARAWVNDYRKSKVGAGGSDEGGRGDLGAAQEPLPIYQTCVCCTGAVEVRRVKFIPVCPECESQIRGALKPEKP